MSLLPDLPAVARAAGEGELLRGVAGVSYLVRLSGADTGGELAVIECVLAPGATGAAPHTHLGHAEHFEVATGEVTFLVGVEERVMGADGWLSVPRGTRHGFRNDGTTEALLRFMVTPAGYEGYFRAIDALVRAGRVPGAEELAALRSGYRTTSG